MRQASQEIREIRWGVGAGILYPSRLGPVSLEVGVREDGGTLTSLSVGWN